MAQLQYTQLTYSSILTQINDLLNSDGRFSNFKESAIAQTMLEIFSGVADLVNYNLERRAEESYLSTAKLRSSVILLAAQLGYVVSRPVPAQSTLKIKISGDMTTKGIVANDLLQIPAHTEFTYDSNTFTLLDTFTHIFTSAEAASLASDANYEQFLTIDSDGVAIKVAQGEIKTKIIEGATNQQVGQKFQIYKIADTEFSNRYGDEDYDLPVTNVYVGNGKTVNTQYQIDRRSLMNWDVISDFVRGDPVKMCLIRTTPDENVELVFGDAVFAEIGANVSASGPQTLYDSIYLDYFATKGAEVNQTGVIGNPLDASISVKVNGDNAKDITSNVEFQFATNIVGGADLEDIDSIKINSPNIYYSLDRLITKRDYIAYLKTLTTPIDIRNALAWGEQEEMVGTTRTPIQKLFNVVLYCVCGPLYTLTGSNYLPKTGSDLSTAVLDMDFDEDSVAQQSYFNIYIKEDVVEQLKKYEVVRHKWVVFGDTTTDTYLTAKNNYDAQPFYLTYGSEVYLSATVDTKYTDNIILSAVGSMDDVAARIEDAFVTFTDTRGTSATNSNYGNLALSATECVWDSTNERFIVSGGADDRCYIQDIVADLYTINLGLKGKSSESVSYTTANEAIATNIITVTDKIAERSLITCRPVYISPILQKFNLTGNIYMKKLANKEETHRKIKNEIYTWLDKECDFNTEIYLSNLIEIVESYPDVTSCNIKLVQDYPVPDSGTVFFDPATDSRLAKDQYASEKAGDIAIFQAEIIDYIGTRTSNTESSSNYPWLDIAHTATYLKSESWRTINERTFFNVLVKNIYDALPSNNSSGDTPLRDSPDFLDIVSDMHKDLLYMIRLNMLDSSGNIAREDTVQVVNGVEEVNYYRGGYSLGCEIPKVTIATTAVYL